MDRTCEYIERTGNFECLKRIHTNYKIPLSMTNTCMWAATHSNIEMLEWAVSKGCEKNADAFMMAASNGDITMLEWLVQNGFPWDGRTCAEAAGSGHLNALIWARSRGCAWDSRVYSKAAEHGHLEVIKWAYANECPWDDVACTLAIEGKREEVLKWILHERRVNVTLKMIKTTIAQEDLNMLELILKHKHPNLQTFPMRAGRWYVSDRRALTLILDNFAVSQYAFNYTIQFGTLDCLKMLHAKGFEWNDQSATVAASVGKVHVLKWLKEVGCQFDDRIVFSGIKCAHKFVIEWGLQCLDRSIPDEAFFRSAMFCESTEATNAILIKCGLQHDVK